MKKIVLISCVKTKLDHPAKAEDLYVSPLFRYNLAYAHKLKPDLIFILSAKYGLLRLTDHIAPYEKTLKTMPVAERRAWAESVLAGLSKYASLMNDEFIFLAGDAYREYLVPKIRHYVVPFEGVSFGNQLKALKQLVGKL